MEEENYFEIFDIPSEEDIWNKNLMIPSLKGLLIHPTNESGSERIFEREYYTTSNENPGVLFDITNKAEIKSMRKCKFIKLKDFEPTEILHENIDKKYFDIKNIRYINIIFHNKNLLYLYKYINFILSKKVDNTKVDTKYLDNLLYIFNIITDVDTFNYLVNDKNDYKFECKKEYKTFGQSIDDESQNIYYNHNKNYIIDLYTSSDKLMRGIGYKRAYANKLFTDNFGLLSAFYPGIKETPSSLPVPIDKENFSVLTIDDNISSIMYTQGKNRMNTPKLHGGEDQYLPINISISEILEILLEKIKDFFMIGILKGEGTGVTKGLPVIGESCAIYKIKRF